MSKAELIPGQTSEHDRQHEPGLRVWIEKTRV